MVAFLIMGADINPHPTGVKVFIRPNFPRSELRDHTITVAVFLDVTK